MLLTSVIIDIWEYLLVSVYVLLEGNSIPFQKAREQAHFAYESSCIRGLFSLIPYEK